MTDYRGKWALITGASAGIGAEFARAIAARGGNVILTARRRDRLETLAQELKSTFSVEALVIEADFTDHNAPDTVMAAIDAHGAPVDILVNNAGFGMPGQYLDHEWPDHDAYLRLMVASYAHFVRLALPGMVECGYGRIIQVASLAGLLPGSSGHTLYGACKAFLISFSQSLAAEWNGKGVKVSALCPGLTYSEFHDVNGARATVSKLPKFMFMDAAPVIEAALRAVEDQHTVIVPGTWNKFLAWLTKALPRPWGARLMANQSKRARRQSI
ncbi:MAG: SDR family oxidoreductase [Pseudomonadota bacterium]